MQEIITVPVLILKDEQFEVEKFGDGKVIDFAFKNIGATAVLLWGMFPLAVGEGLVSFPGYKDKIRKDSISISFTGGTGSLLVLITKYAC
jgi:hypothetical protein